DRQRRQARLMPCGDEPKRVWLWFLGLLFRECNLLFLFSNASKQTKPVRFFSKDRSGLSGKADIEGRFVVGRGNVQVLFRPKRHTGMALEQFGVTHVRPSGGPRRSKQTLLEKLSSHVGARSRKRSGASILCLAQGIRAAVLPRSPRCSPILFLFRSPSER